MANIIRPEINNQIFSWAIARIGITPDEVVLKYPKFLQWQTGETSATVNQLKDFSNSYHFPFGYFFLRTIPLETTQNEIPFFRSNNEFLAADNENVNETVKILKNRQEWLSGYMKDNGVDKNSIIGKYKDETNIQEITVGIRNYLELNDDWYISLRSPIEAIRLLKDKLEERNIIITFNSVVNNNGHRHIPVKLCRGFCLIDDYTPFIFVNSSDSKSAQLFTIVHEIAHIFISYTAGYGDHGVETLADPREALCDQIAANLLVPEDALLANSKLTNEELAKLFNVSELVILRRKLDCKLISKRDFNEAYHMLPPYKKTGSSGGDFYRTAEQRISPKLLRCLNNAIHERAITPMEAYRLSGLKGDTFTRLTAGELQ